MDSGMWLSLLPFIILTTVSAVPCWRIIKRLGLPRWIILFVLAPYGGLIIFVWIVAYSRYQIDKSGS